MSHRQRQARLERRRRSAAGIGARAVGVGSGALAAALIPVGSAQAAGSTFTVTNLNDSGTGSLRQAITSADASPGDDIIVFASGLTGDIQLQSPLPQITTNVDIQGPGARTLALNASGVTGSGAIINNYYHAVTVSGVTVENAPSANPSLAGTGPLTLDNDTFANNHGEAVYAQSAVLTINGSTFTDNKGGAIRAGFETLNALDSTIEGNSAPAGGAIDSYGSSVNFRDSTITGNASTSGCGGGINASGNYYYPGSLSLDGSIVAGNSQPSTCSTTSPDVYLGSGYYPSSLSSSFSLIENTTGLPSGDLNSTDLTGVSPDLGPLQNNGGPTDTELPKSGSPVIDAGQAFSATLDQRGLPRTVDFPGVTNRGDGTDMGAAELQLPPSLSGVSPAKALAGQSVTISGTDLGQATKVLFGSANATYHVVDPSHISAVVPAGSGTVDVRVLTADGESAPSSADHFTFEFMPTLVKSGKASAHWKHGGVVVTPGITVHCPKGGAACHTSVTGHSKVRGLGGKTKKVLVGSAHVVTLAGGQHALAFKLNHKGLSALRRQGHLRIVVESTATDDIEQATATKTITIRMPKKS